MVQCSTKVKKKLSENWGAPLCEIKTIYIKEYFKVDGATYTDDLRLKMILKEDHFKQNGLSKNKTFKIIYLFLYIF